MKFSDVQTFLTDGLTSLGYTSVPPIVPGPLTVATLQKRYPGALILVMVGGGVGLNIEQTFDRPFITVRCIGSQHDYDSAETLAKDVDGLFLALNGNATIGTAKVLWITRTGAGPEIVEWDTADRHHFQCQYIANTQTGL